MTESVEMMKISFRQDAKEGMVICFAVDPAYMPEELWKAPIGSRFACALVQIDDNEKPVPPQPKAEKAKKKQNANVMRAAIACGEEKFQQFLQHRYAPQWKAAFGTERDKAANALRTIMGVDSRRALATEPEALTQFDRVMGEYELWKRGE